jgi:hypothetical protein
MANNDHVVNAEKAAKFSGAYVETTRRLARKGELPAYKIAKDWRCRLTGNTSSRRFKRRVWEMGLHAFGKGVTT